MKAKRKKYSAALKAKVGLEATLGVRTVGQIAKEYQVPIDFECEDGECGTCAVRVSSVDDKQRMGYHLTEKEKAVLRSIGKLSKDELERLIVDDMPSDWRLACQMIVRDEDILVEY